MATIYYTGSTLDGFLATPDHSLDWLLSRDIDPGGPMGFETFEPRIGATVMGASTWQWMVDHGEEAAVAGSPSWVLTHRAYSEVESVRFTAADTPDDVRRVHAEAVEAAGGRDVWLVGGGDLVGQFADLGLLDEVWVQFAPVTIGAGAPLLTRHVELRLEEVARNREFVCTRYTVVRDGTLAQ